MELSIELLCSQQSSYDSWKIGVYTQLVFYLMSVHNVLIVPQFRKSKSSLKQARVVASHGISTPTSLQVMYLWVAADQR